MKVSELAAELEVPASAVLDQCQRFGIDATWAGAELSSSEVVIVRSEMAGLHHAADLTSAADGGGVELALAPPELAAVGAATAVDDQLGSEHDEAAPVAPAAPVVPAAPDAVPPPDGPPTAALPPTAVGSLPGLIDEVTPAPEEPEPTTTFRMGAAEGAGHQAEPGVERRVPPREPPATRHLDRSARNAPIALFVAVLAFGVSNVVDSPVLVALLWIVAAVAVVMSIVDAARGRRNVQIHPERRRGLWLSVVTLVLAFGVAVALGAAVIAVFSTQPASAAPLGVGDLSSVQSARWGYQRAKLLQDHGWKRPARDAGTCWQANDVMREFDRVEVSMAPKQVGCTSPHVIEVSKAFAVDRDADSAYPGAAALQRLVSTRCGSAVVRLRSQGKTVTLRAEYPTEKGWNHADHDVVCALVTPTRSSALVD
ncbi:septum formation family protein [Aquihabitans sp. McL0605]|uniref:septum formation family protein n=1 Tax=Aquihabitans sp. McL0605 TaxID=3415671 RepID=UPI003CED21B7